jgi:hypothetical protein
MTTATFNYLDGIFNSFVIEGHADYADYGQDIVCSSITTATFQTIGLLQRFFPKSANYVEKDGYIELKMVEAYNEKVNQEIVKQIIENFMDVLDNIKQQYPNNLKLIIARK